MSQENVEQTFQVTAPARLILSNIRGSVEIHSGDEDVIRVTAAKQTHPGDAERTKIEMVQEADGTVRVATRFPDGAWGWLFGSFPCRVDYVVTAPARCSLKVNGVSNSLKAEGFEGEFAINSVSGEIELHSMTGALRLHTVSGEVSGERISGSLDLDTVSGDVHLKEASLSQVKSTTISGRVNLQTPLATGPYHFKSVSGDVRLILPPDAGCITELHSVSGQIISAFPLSGFSHVNGTHSAEVHGGGAYIDLHSVSGDLVLESDGEVGPSASPRKEPSAEERREILERVEQGEMTVDEGVARLRG